MPTTIESKFTLGELHYVIVPTNIFEACGECGHEKETPIKNYTIHVAKLVAIRIEHLGTLTSSRVKIDHFVMGFGSPITESCIFPLSEEKAARKKCGQLKNAETQYRRKRERELKNGKDSKINCK
jgi:hypothetical protein